MSEIPFRARMYKFRFNVRGIPLREMENQSENSASRNIHILDHFVVKLIRTPLPSPLPQGMFINVLAGCEADLRLQNKPRTVCEGGQYGG